MQFKGDIDNDGRITSIEASLALKAVINSSLLTTDEELNRADVNNDGKVSILDARKILKHICGEELIDEVIT